MKGQRTGRQKGEQTRAEEGSEGKQATRKGLRRKGTGRGEVKQARKYLKGKGRAGEGLGV